MKGSIKLFTLFGIEIRIHITFLLLPAFFGLYYMINFGPIAGLRAIILISFVFICVIVHEICHSLMAKKYNIEVKDITLLPIGGIASMQAMPENPNSNVPIPGNCLPTLSRTFRSRPKRTGRRIPGT